MKFLNTLIKYIAFLSGDGSMDEKVAGVLVAGALGAIVLTFLICLIGIIAGGGKFNGIASKATKALVKKDNTKFNAVMNKLPKAQKISWDSYKKSHMGLPSSAFPAATCMTAGFDASLAKGAPVAVALVSFMASMAVVIGCAVGFTDIFDRMSLIAMCICPTLGAFFTFLTFVFSRAKFAGIVKAYSKFCAVLDSEFSQSATSHAAPDFNNASDDDDAPAYSNYSYQESAQGNDSIVYNAEDLEGEAPIRPEPIIVTQPSPEYAEYTPEPEPIISRPAPEYTPEPEPIPEPIIVTRPAEPVRPEPIVTRPAEPVRPEPIVTRPAEPVRPEPIVTRPAEPVRPEPIVTRPAEPATRPVEGDIVDRVEKALAENASRAQIRELAKQIQVERARPENSPEQTRRLNDCFGKLIKAMSTARN